MKINFTTFFFILIILLSNTLMIASAQDYQVPYKANDVSMQVELTMTLNDIKEYNVSITNENTSLTAIIEVLDNSGPLWGFYLEKASVYYPLNHSLAGLQACCTKYADHASFYTVQHILVDPDPHYVLAFYDTHGHPAADTHFKAIFLKGTLGNETVITQGPTPAQSFVLYLLLPFSTIIIIAVLVIQFRKIRKYKKEDKKNKPEE